MIIIMHLRIEARAIKDVGVGAVKRWPDQWITIPRESKGPWGQVPKGATRMRESGLRMDCRGLVRT